VVKRINRKVRKEKKQPIYTVLQYSDNGIFEMSFFPLACNLLATFSILLEKPVLKKEYNDFSLHRK